MTIPRTRAYARMRSNPTAPRHSRSTRSPPPGCELTSTRCRIRRGPSSAECDGDLYRAVEHSGEFVADDGLGPDHEVRQQFSRPITFEYIEDTAQ